MLLKEIRYIRSTLKKTTIFMGTSSGSTAKQFSDKYNFMKALIILTLTNLKKFQFRSKENCTCVFRKLSKT